MTKEEMIIEAFYNLKCRNDIANLLGISDKSLRYFLYGRRPENLYTEFDIKKKNGNTRRIAAPHNEFKTIQKKLASILNTIYTPKVCVFGFVNNKNIRINAEKHIKKYELLNIDLEDFFTQIHFGRVRGLFLAKPYEFNEEVATTLAQIVCYNGSLPQGAPTSPVITNMICASLDNDMMKFAKKHKLTYTRYADDLTFSGYKDSILDELVFNSNGSWQLSSELQLIFNKNSFRVNEEKISAKSNSQRHEVTGVITNKFPNVKREYSKTVRALLHNCEKDGIVPVAKKYIEKNGTNNPLVIKAINEHNHSILSEWFSYVIKGKINHIAAIRGADDFLYLTLAKKANHIFSMNLFDVSLLNDFNTIVERNTFVIDNENYQDASFKQGSAFYLSDYGLVTSYHVINEKGTYDLYTQDSFSKGLKICSIDASNLIEFDETIDYAIFDATIDNVVKLHVGNSKSLKIGDCLTVAGFPNMIKGNTITIQPCRLISIANYLGCELYKVNGRIVHGYSGGIVLNSQKEVVGIVKAGIVSLDEDETNDIQGFVPIHVVLDDIKKKRRQ